MYVFVGRQTYAILRMLSEETERTKQVTRLSVVPQHSHRVSLHKGGT